MIAIQFMCLLQFAHWQFMKFVYLDKVYFLSNLYLRIWVRGYRMAGTPGADAELHPV